MMWIKSATPNAAVHPSKDGIIDGKISFSAPFMSPHRSTPIVIKKEPSNEKNLHHGQPPQHKSKAQVVIKGGGYMLYGDSTDDVDQQIDDMLVSGVAPIDTTKLLPGGFARLHSAMAELCDTSTRQTIESIRTISLDGNTKCITSTCRRQSLLRSSALSTNSERSFGFDSNYASSDRSLRQSYLGITLPEEKRVSIKRSTCNLMSASSMAAAIAEDEEEKKDEVANLVSNDEELTEEERCDIEKWQTRFTTEVGASVFDKGYIPKRCETSEMVEIAEYLGFNMNVYEHEQSTIISSLSCNDQATKHAIQTIFFPNRNERQSVLLKRGPVLVGGEDERELIMLTHGFVLARMEMDTLVDVLLDQSQSSRTDEEEEDLVFETLCERFNEFDSTDHRGSLDRYEIVELFQSEGIPVATYTLDLMMNRFGMNSNGLIDLDEFKAMLHHGIQEHNQEKQCGLGPWLKKALGNKKKKKRSTLGKQKKLRKLDVAYCMSDIDKIVDVGLCYGADVFDPDCAHLTFAVYIKNMKEPLVITCSKHCQVQAWMESFCTCIRGLKSLLPHPKPHFGNPSQDNLDLKLKTRSSMLYHYQEFI